MVRVPASLREAFGETQSVVEIVVVLSFGIVGTTTIFMLHPSSVSGLPVWRSALALILVFDVLAGCLANFTRGTNEYYAHRPRARWVFIAVHVHLVLIAALLDAAMGPAWIMWAYTICGASFVNAIRTDDRQVFVAATLLAIGLALNSYVHSAGPMEAVAALFLIKVLFGFAVDHARDK